MNGILKIDRTVFSICDQVSEITIFVSSTTIFRKDKLLSHVHQTSFSMVDTLLHFLAHGLVVIVHRTARHGNLSISRMEMGSHSMATGVIDRYCSCFLRLFN